jgi:hypothetical protein
VDGQSRMEIRNWKMSVTLTFIVHVLWLTHNPARHAGPCITLAYC